MLVEKRTHSSAEPEIGPRLALLIALRCSARFVAHRTVLLIALRATPDGGVRGYVYFPLMRVMNNCRKRAASDPRQTRAFGFSSVTPSIS